MLSSLFFAVISTSPPLSSWFPSSDPKVFLSLFPFTYLPRSLFPTLSSKNVICIYTLVNHSHLCHYFNHCKQNKTILFQRDLRLLPPWRALYHVKLPEDCTKRNFKVEQRHQCLCSIPCGTRWWREHKHDEKVTFLKLIQWETCYSLYLSFYRVAKCSSF